ncbi:hypothetical protein [Propionibacterium australiense]|uniref:hypothetical protein n=1 Tax=Propionibacterium australiense TaxID=119981 RepID=UPI0011C46F6F|nr:hypothetical protein [Propionibacterium australiense]
MTQTAPAPEANISLVRGTAIAALVYHGAIFFVVMVFALAYGPIIFIFGGAALAMEDYDRHAMRSAGIFLLECIAALLAATSPFVLAVCMFIAARRNDLRQVKVVLVLFTLVTVLTLVGMVVWFLTDGSNTSPAVLLVVAPECAVVILGWIGWTRTGHSSATAPDRSPHQMSQPFPTAPPAQSHGPVPHHDQPQTFPPTSPWQGQESPWQGPGRMS